MVYKLSLFPLLDLLLPMTCGLCDARTGSNFPLCNDCLEEMPSITCSCPQCALPATTSATCGACQQNPPAFDRVVALYHYQPPVNTLVQQMKFSNRLEYSTLFGHLLAERLAAMDARPDLLVPVPLHHSRLRKRGYNQSWEITRSLARSSGIESSRTLCCRVRKTPLQTGLDARQRRKNLKQAFRVTADLGGKHVCIIDDVMTTGSTLNEMARTLKRAGAERVSGWVVARVVL